MKKLLLLLLLVGTLRADSIRIEVLDDAGKVKSTTLIPIPVGDTPPVDPPPIDPPPVDPPPPGGTVPPPGPIPESIVTHHDTVLIQGRIPTKTVVKAGRWLDVETWSGKAIPTALDKVLIQAGATVSLDGTAEADTLIVEGALTFNPVKPTKLLVTTLTVLPVGSLEIGTEKVPVTGSVELVIRDKPINLTADPLGYGNGLSVFGKFTASGSPKTAHARLAGELAAGEVTIAVKAPLVNWKAGDEVLFPDTRQLMEKERGLQYVGQWERRIIESVAADNLSFKVTQPLLFAHTGAKDSTGKLETTPHVANLSREIVISSQNPAGTPGHTMFLDRARVSIRFVKFLELGRTTNEKLGVTNQIGRYPCHLHHLLGPEVPVAGAPQFTIFGCVIDGGTAPHNRKWGFTIHGTHYGLLASNVIWNSIGMGIMFEDGTETGNVVEDNLIIRVAGKGGRVDTSNGAGTQGGGIYVRGPGNYIRRNVVANCFDNYAYLINFFYLGKITIPTGPGKDPHHDGRVIDGNAGGLAEFADNEAYSNMDGLTFWWVGTYGNKTPEGVQESVIKNFYTWNHWRYGVFQYPCARVTMDGFKTRGTMPYPQGALAWYGADYKADDVIIRGDIQGQRGGFTLSNYGNKQIIENSTIHATHGFNFSVPWTNTSDASGIRPRLAIIRNCKIKGFAAEPFVAVTRSFPLLSQLANRTQNIVVLDEVIVEKYQGADDNFKVYYQEQLPDYVVPQTIKNPKYPGNVMVGAPEPGLTNAQLWEKYGLAIGGEIAPCATVRPNIVGLACPIPAIK